MSKYFLFAGYDYYPSSRLGDLVGSYASHMAALRAAASKDGDWWCIATIDDNGDLIVVDESR